MSERVHLIDLVELSGVKVTSQDFEFYTKAPKANLNRVALKRICETGLGNLAKEQRSMLWESFKDGDIIVVRHCPCGKGCGKKTIETIPVE